MKIQWNNITQEAFLEQYWQKKPIVLKQAIPNYQDEITPEELAGLAMEEFIDSRLITNLDNNWQVQHGPFDNFEHLPENHWSLLVQGVDNWHDPVAKLKDLVSFLPKWRIDDVMLSYSTEGAGVGAHLDQYDVFILQGQGKRRWQAGEVDKTLQQQEISKDLLQLDSFVTIIDEVLEAGDIIYIPPFSPHQGVTMEACFNYSIGFRAPSAKELLSEFADHVIDNELGNKRFQNSTIEDALGAHTNSSLINASDTNQLQNMLTELINQPDVFAEFLNQHLTKPTRELDINDEITPDNQTLNNELQNEDVCLSKVMGLRTSILLKESEVLFFCNGVKFICECQQTEFLKLLESHPNITIKMLKSFPNWLENHQLMSTLVSHGFWYIDNGEMNESGFYNTEDG